MKITLAEVQTAISEYRKERGDLLGKITILEQDNNFLRIQTEKLRDNRTIHQKLNDARDLLVEWGWIRFPEQGPATFSLKCRRCRNPLETLGDKQRCSNDACPDYLWFTKGEPV